MKKARLRLCLFLLKKTVPDYKRLYSLQLANKSYFCVKRNKMIVDYERILKGLIQGKESSLEKLYDVFFYPLCSYAYSFIADEAIVADIVQELFIKLWERRMDFNSFYSLRAFLYISVRNACLNELRRSNRRDDISLSENDYYVDEDLIIREEVYRMIMQEIEALPSRMRQVFEMTLLDFSIKEIAECLNIAESTVKNQRVLARKKLQIRLKDYLSIL